jgi:hypothetical protein
LHPTLPASSTACREKQRIIRNHMAPLAWPDEANGLRRATSSTPDRARLPFTTSRRAQVARPPRLDVDAATAAGASTPRPPRHARARPILRESITCSCARTRPRPEARTTSAPRRLGVHASVAGTHDRHAPLSCPLDAHSPPTSAERRRMFYAMARTSRERLRAACDHHNAEIPRLPAACTPAPPR